MLTFQRGEELAKGQVRVGMLGLAYSDGAVVWHPSAGKWCAKEVVGHFRWIGANALPMAVSLRVAETT
jgi:hypothetical protein